jgi:hypothetical protein
MGAAADLIGERRCAERHALAGEPLGLAVERLVLPVLLEQQHREEAGPGPAARDTWKGAGACAIFSQSRHENFSRTVWMTFHERGITSSVSVTSSPSLEGGCCRRPGRNRGRARRRARAAGDRGTASLLGRLRSKAVTVSRPLLRGLGRQLILGGIGLEIFELQLHLCQQAAAAFGAGAVGSRFSLAICSLRWAIIASVALSRAWRWRAAPLPHRLCGSPRSAAP